MEIFLRSPASFGDKSLTFASKVLLLLVAMQKNTNNYWAKPLEENGGEGELDPVKRSDEYKSRSPAGTLPPGTCERLAG